MSLYPQDAATCSGVHPSLSTWFTLAPCSKRKDTISMLPSMQDCVDERKTKSKTMNATINVSNSSQRRPIALIKAPPHLVEGSYSIGIGTVDDFCHLLPHSCFGFFSLFQHQLGLLCVSAGTGRQELRSPVKPHPFPTDRVHS